MKPAKGTMAAFIVYGVERHRAQHQVSAGWCDLWMVWPDTEERDELIALLRGEAWPPSRNGR